MRHWVLITLAALGCAMSCGCAVTHRATGSLQTPAALINISKNTASADFRKATMAEGLKCGESDEVNYFCWPYPPVKVTAGDESVRKAMLNGKITDLWWIDYEVRHYLIISFIKVFAYGK